MKKEVFIKIISMHQKIFQEFHELSRLGFDFYEGKYKLTARYEEIFDILLENTFSKEGKEWIDWFIWENDYGNKKLKATDNGKSICYSVESLYDYIEQYLKKDRACKI
jgi:hypothetical protein